MIAAKVSGHPVQLLPVVGEMESPGPILSLMDTRPDDVPSLKTAFIGSKDNKAGLPGQSESFFDAFD